MSRLMSVGWTAQDNQQHFPITTTTFNQFQKKTSFISGLSRDSLFWHRQHFFRSLLEARLPRFESQLSAPTIQHDET